MRSGCLPCSYCVFCASEYKLQRKAGRAQAAAEAAAAAAAAAQEVYSMTACNTALQDCAKFDRYAGCQIRLHLVVGALALGALPSDRLFFPFVKEVSVE